MKFFALALACFLSATAITAVADDVNATALRGLPLTFSLTPNATELLQAHGLWAPDLTAFAAGDPNVNGTMDLTTEAEGLKASGLDANDLIEITVDTAAAISQVLDEEGDTGCDQCTKCQMACFALAVFLPFYGM